MPNYKLILIDKRQQLPNASVWQGNEICQNGNEIVKKFVTLQPHFHISTEEKDDNSQ